MSRPRRPHLRVGPHSRPVQLHQLAFLCACCVWPPIKGKLCAPPGPPAISPECPGPQRPPR
eukprot:6301134-Pyramimonas_sp.AAC.1